MKSWYRRGVIALALIAAATAIALRGNAYLQFISERIYEDSTAHLMEIYGQVNDNFNLYLERNWGNLDDWDHYLRLEKDDDGVLPLLKGRQERWGFSDFYFLAKDGSYLTYTGETGTLELANVRDLLFEDGERVLSSERTSIGQSITVFSIPVEPGSYRGFDYSAIAISYTNADIVHSLRVDAYAGQSFCFVIDARGNVYLSTSESGSAIGNYVAYLRASGLTEAQLAVLESDWEAGNSGVMSCQIGGVDSYLSYRSVGYQNCVLLGIVPQSVAGESLLLIQRETINVLVRAFLLGGAIVILWMLYAYWRKTKRSAAELKYRDVMFNILSNNVNDIFLMLDAETLHVDFLSSNVERLLGIPHADVLANIGLLGESAVEQNEYIKKDIFEGIPLHGNRQWERAHTHRTTLERRWYRETVYRETIQGMGKYLIVMSDRTEEEEKNRNLQIALDAAESANEAKRDFLSNMSHDIRTPMNAIIGFSVLLAKDADNPEKVREYTRKISASGSHLLSLINDVLDMSKIESKKASLNVSEFSLPEVLEELYTIILPQAKAKKQNFEMRLEGRMPEHLMGDKLRLNQILLNILSNAVKYTQIGGQIDFVVEYMRSTSEQFVCLRFKVKDNGLGMSEEFLENIFNPFTREVNSTTSGIQGTGLGMAITKSLVDLMGGTIGVESKIGEGSLFTVELSFSRSNAETDAEFWKRSGISRVLVADDEEMICLDVKESMRETGVEVTYVTDGFRAVEEAVRAKAEGRAFHVILLDWKMPGMNGVETARKIREEVCGEIPILVLTSYDWGDIEDEARAAGIDAFLPKPFFVSSFRNTLETLQPEEQAKEKEAAPAENALDGMRFLVAEDNELNAEILSELLDIENAGCERAENGQEALDMFCKSAPGYYDMILMDVQMPVMNGYEATRAIRACAHPAAKTIPIVAMTANAFAEDVRNALDAGMNGHLAKPVDMDTVKALIGKLRGDGSGEENQ